MQQLNNNTTDFDDDGVSSSFPPAALPESSLFEIAFRNRWWILACTVSALVLGSVYLFFATPIFTVTSRVYVEQKLPEFDGIENNAVMAGSKNYLYTQVELFRSTPVLSSVLMNPNIKGMKIFFEVDNPLEFLKASLNVSVGKKDDIINVCFDSAYPETAVQLVNAVVDSYITFQSNQKKGSTSQVLRILQNEKVKREAELTDKFTAMSAFMQENIVAASGDDVSAIMIDLNKLQLRLTDLDQSGLTDKHPAVIAVEINIEKLKKQNELNARYAILQADYERIRARCDELDDSIKKESIKEDAGALNISIIEVASMPDKPSKPQKARVLAMALVLGLMLGGGVALLRDTMDQKIHSTDEISAILDIPVLGSVPSMPPNETVSARGQKIWLESDSFSAEVYRTIRTAIFFGAPSDTTQTILVTSPDMGEGKSTLVSNLAIAMAQADQKTLILDADLRKHNQHNIFQVSNEVGLTSVVAGKTPLDQAIQSTDVDGLDLLVTGPVVQNPAEILNSAQFSQLLKDLSARYERIIIDSPPVIPVTDAHILTGLCDITLLVLRVESSTRKAARQARQTLLSVGANLLGVVANDVSKRSSGYGYAYGDVYGNREPVKKDLAKKNLRVERA
ncbi:MAG: polysaccharide biosynthesis tyrosine autokinase [Desulfobulbaceae bacterium]|nr:polysaccharide biosynthesis tyrosine autokinase [Desulfobulbaceae bacterium]